MTREEAIKCLKSLLEVRRKYCDMQTMRNEMEALEIAIKALEQEPCEDAISRETARRIVDSGRTRQQMIDMILATPPVNPQEQYYKELAESYEKTINKLTKAIAEQKPKTGRWIWDRTRDWDGECKYECSCCGMGSDVDYAYCMRCGAKMESEDK